jgi:hypothetical protein
VGEGPRAASGGGHKEYPRLWRIEIRCSRVGALSLPGMPDISGPCGIDDHALTTFPNRWPMVRRACRRLNNVGVDTGEGGNHPLIRPLGQENV